MEEPRRIRAMNKTELARELNISVKSLGRMLRLWPEFKHVPKGHYIFTEVEVNKILIKAD